MLDIRIRSENDEQFQKVLETLRPLGVEVVTSEDDPLVAALFYVARMNSKLDNLGQLRHLTKIVGSIGKLADAAEQQRIYYNKLNQERHYVEARKLALFKKLKDFFQDAETKYPHSSEIVFMTEKEIVRLFEAVAKSESSVRFLRRELDKARDN